MSAEYLALWADPCGYCARHGVLYTKSLGCTVCATERQQRDEITVLDARISDLVAENADLRRRVSALEHRMTDLQLSHNRLAVEYESSEPFEDLLL